MHIAVLVAVLAAAASGIAAADARFAPAGEGAGPSPPVPTDSASTDAAFATEAPDWCRERPAAFRDLERIQVRQSWFEVYRVRSGVFALHEPWQYEKVISWLIVGERRALLFDTGLGVGRIADVVRELTALPVIVINSHTHFDHVGGTAEFDEVWNEDTPFSRANAGGQLDDYARATLEPARLCGPLPSELETRLYELRPWRASYRVADGERIDLGGREIEVLFTPGHAPDSLCLLDREHGLLFTGDTYYPGPIYLFAPGTDLDAYARSVSMLADLVPTLSLLLPAHEVPVAEPAQLTALEDAIARVRSGSATPVPSDGLLEYRFDGFSLLLAPD
jgi:glyoxylase-like metal-dependent hydrolase (beta-lactamase superfamily II)